jgi:hypothetical protein
MSQWFQRRSHLRKVDDRHTDALMDDGRQRNSDHKSSPSALCAQVN